MPAHAALVILFAVSFDLEYTAIRFRLSTRHPEPGRRWFSTHGSHYAKAKDRLRCAGGPSKRTETALRDACGSVPCQIMPLFAAGDEAAALPESRSKLK